MFLTSVVLSLEVISSLIACLNTFILSCIHCNLNTSIIILCSCLLSKPIYERLMSVPAPKFSIQKPCNRLCPLVLNPATKFPWTRCSR